MSQCIGNDCVFVLWFVVIFRSVGVVIATAVAPHSRKQQQQKLEELNDLNEAHKNAHKNVMHLPWTCK